MKNRGVAAILALFFGFIGVHRFYLGQRFLGVLYIILLFVFGLSFIISLIDVLGFLFMSKERFDYRYNRKYFEDDYLEFLKKREKHYNSGPPKKRSAKAPAKHKVISRQEGVAQLKARGKELFKNYEFEEAIEVFGQVLAINPRDAAIHFNLACCFSLLENDERGFRHLSLAVENGLDKFEKINSHPALAWLRIQNEWMSFATNNYRLGPSAIDSPKADLLDEISDDKKLNLKADQDPPGKEKILVKLKKIKDLRDRGLISDLEFSEEKKKLL